MPKSSFHVSDESVQALISKGRQYLDQMDADMDRKIKDGTQIVFKIATSRRPWILNKYGRKVSDPGAAVGVPVRTGALRASIKEESGRKNKKWEGRVWTDLEYAKFLEFGTSRMKARPFMREAWQVSQEGLRLVFRRKPIIKL